MLIIIIKNEERGTERDDSGVPHPSNTGYAIYNRTGPLVRECSRFERVIRAGAGHSPRPATSPNRPM